MSKIKICLDAGHYGKYNPSPVVKSYYESDMTWKLHLLLKKYLEQYGFEVKQTRASKEKDLSVHNRGIAANGYDLLLSLHSNACDTESVDYPVVIVPLDGSGNALGQLLADCIASTMGTKQKGKIWTRKSSSGGEWYGVIRGAAAVGVPGLILEHSFHTNTKATKWLMDDANLDKLAQAEAKCIADYYGAEIQPEATEKTVDYTLGMRYLREGCEGEDVRALQILLNANGCPCGTADGIFGKKTGDAVAKYQGKKNLTQDRVAGRDTMGAILGIK